MHYVELEEYKNIVKEILKTVDSICRERNLRYQICYGTLLGAVRHQGFIPWDDDVDIFMPLSDYHKLMEILENEDHGIHFIDIKTNAETPFPFGKICASDTFAYERDYKPFEGYGAYIDVFPIIHVPNNPVNRLIQWYRVRQRSIITKESGKTAPNRCDSCFMNMIFSIGYFMSRFVNTRKSNQKVAALMEKLDEKNTNWMGAAVERTASSLFDFDIFQDMIDLDFEGFKVKAPKNWDLLLRMNYGDTYMTPPPVEKQVSNHSIVCCR